MNIKPIQYKRASDVVTFHADKTEWATRLSDDSLQVFRTYGNVPAISQSALESRAACWAQNTEFKKI